MSVGPDDLVKGYLPFSKNKEKFTLLMKNIDSKIKLEINLLNKYNEQKNYLLQNLFI